jgi:hypothetical protein
VIAGRIAFDEKGWHIVPEQPTMDGGYIYNAFVLSEKSLQLMEV